MADFRKAGHRYDKSFTTLALLKGQDAQVDLWGGGPGGGRLLVSLASSTVAERSELPPPGAVHLRRFRIRGKAEGETRLEARVSVQGVAYAEPLLIAVYATAERRFIAELLARGETVARRYRLPVSIMLAQACLESDFGRHDHALAHNILYGITKRDELWSGKEPDFFPACRQKVLRKTVVENKKGERVVKSVPFCGATNFREAVEIWAQYVTRHPGSAGVRSLFREGPWTDQELTRIANTLPGLAFGAASSRARYGPKVMEIIRKWRLMQYDESN